MGNHSWEQSDTRLRRVVVMGQKRRDQPRTAFLKKTNPQNLPVSWSEMENGGKRGRLRLGSYLFANSLLGRKCGNPGKTKLGVLSGVRTGDGVTTRTAAECQLGA